MEIEKLTKQSSAYQAALRNLRNLSKMQSRFQVREYPGEVSVVDTNTGTDYSVSLFSGSIYPTDYSVFPPVILTSLQSIRDTVGNVDDYYTAY